MAISFDSLRHPEYDVRAWWNKPLAVSDLPKVPDDAAVQAAGAKLDKTELGIYKQLLGLRGVANLTIAQARGILYVCLFGSRKHNALRIAYQLTRAAIDLQNLSDTQAGKLFKELIKEENWSKPMSAVTGIPIHQNTWKLQVWGRVANEFWPDIVVCRKGTACGSFKKITDAISDGSSSTLVVAQAAFALMEPPGFVSDQEWQEFKGRLSSCKPEDDL